MDDLKSGTAAYMDLYPEASSDGALRLGNIVPDFSAETTHGTWESFHEWKKGKWAILFSHPADFTPVCTTEIGRLALKYDYLESLDCKVATLSVDPVKSHTAWLEDVVAHCENKIEVSPMCALVMFRMFLLPSHLIFFRSNSPLSEMLIAVLVPPLACWTRARARNKNCPSPFVLFLSLTLKINSC